MADRTKIEWTDATWNPFRGTVANWHCTKVSPGCKFCYAERMNVRFGGPRYIDRADLMRVADARTLAQPRRWRRPRMVFVNSMTDTFHEQVEPAWLDFVWGVMQECPHHTFQVLTKREQRMRDYLRRRAESPVKGVLPNVWLGVSVESQEFLHLRWPQLQRTPAALRWLSAEPMLGPINLDKIDTTGLRWVVCGGESGPGARPMHAEWVRTLRDQCRVRDIAFLFKQWGNWDDRMAYHRSKVDAGRSLDGRTHDEYPTYAMV